MKTYQGNAFDLFMQTKQTVEMHLKRQMLKRQKMNVKERGFFSIYFFGVKQGITSDRTMNIQSNSCRPATGSIPNKPLN